MHIRRFCRLHVLVHVLDLLLELMDSVLVFFSLLFEASQLTPQADFNGGVLVDDFLHSLIVPVLPFLERFLQLPRLGVHRPHHAGLLSGNARRSHGRQLRLRRSQFRLEVVDVVFCFPTDRSSLCTELAFHFGGTRLGTAFRGR